MIERVTKAIFDKLIADNGPYTLAQGDKPSCITLDGNFDLGDLARAAVESMREPTQEMIKSVGSGEDNWGRCTTDEDCGHIWRGMVDEILKD